MPISTAFVSYSGALPIDSTLTPSEFVTRAEYSWTWLATSTIPNMQTFIAQANALEANVNAKEISANTSATNAATSAATATAAANRAQSVVIPTNAAYATGVQDWRDTAMSKAQFNALAAERRANRAGSGFDEFGKHSLSIIGYPNVNEGIVTNPTQVNGFGIGENTSNSIGISKTGYPIALVNGVSSRVQSVNTSTTYGAIPLLPTAPTILPFGTTLTAEQIASGVVTHADASNSGLIVNGKFDTDTSGWTAANGATLSIVSNKLRVTEDGTTSSPEARQVITTVIGKQYTLEFETTFYDQPFRIFIGSVASGGSSDYSGVTTSASGRFTATFTASSISTLLRFQVVTLAGGASYADFDNIAVFPSDAISRSDLVFLESWHEDVSEKDFVYPLGNVQYLGTTGDSGTPVAGAFAGFGTYSLFGNWQASSALVGKGYVWSTLSDANKKAFVANPENNCYLDGDKVIQVRYRMRVVQGLGDSWAYIDPQVNVLMGYSASTTSLVRAKGKQVSTLDYILSAYTEGVYRPVNDSNVIDKVYGQYKAFANTAESSALAYDGKCFAMPIAIVHRRNQGFAHPVYNPNGTELASDGNKWYNTAVSFTSIADCFTASKQLATSGYIGTTSGRADGLFYDQIHEGDITDIRNSSQKVEDYNRLIDREFNKAVAGTVRGTEGEWAVTYSLATTVSSVSFFAGTTNGLGTYIVIPTPVSFLTVDTYQEIVNGAAKYFAVINGIPYYLTRRDNATTLYIQKILGEKTSFTGSISAGNSVQILVATKSTSIKSNSLTHTDIIGNPANYPTAWKQSGVSGTPLVVAEGGTSLLPTGTTGSDGLAAYKLSKKMNALPLQVLKSTDGGTTWSLLVNNTHYSYSLGSNTVVFIAPYLPLVADLIMVTYQTHTNMATPAVNSEVLAIGDAWASNHVTFPQIVASLLGKVSTGATSPITAQGYSTYGYRVDGTTVKFSVSSTDFPVTSPMTLAGAVGVPTAKVFPYLTRSNGKAYLNLVFKEMKFGSYAAPTVDTGASISHVQYATYQVSIAGCPLDGEIVQWTATTATAAINWALYNKNADGSLYVISSGAAYTNAKMFDGNSWGDDSKFNIVDNVSTTTDDNGATVLIGQKRIELPYFISAGE